MSCSLVLRSAALRVVLAGAGLSLFPLTAGSITAQAQTTDASTTVSGGAVVETRGADRAGEQDDETSPQASRGAMFSAAATNFGPKRIGVISAPASVTITNTGPDDGLTVSAPVFSDPSNLQFGYFTSTTCATIDTATSPISWSPTPIAANQSCRIDFFTLPLNAGASAETVTITTNASTGTPSSTLPLSVTGTDGYYLATAAGQVGGYGLTSSQGNASVTPAQPVVGLDTTRNGDGVWRVAADGGVFTSGTASFYGSQGSQALASPIVGIAQTGTDRGYWLVARDGGVFSFGGAEFFGLLGATRLNAPIVGMAATPTGRGYWLVAADGGVFSFGDAQFLGSLGATRLNAPVVGMAAAADGRGYWLVARDGGVFTFGNTGFFGSTGGQRLNADIVGLEPNSLGDGYWLVARDGGVFTFGRASFVGSAGGQGFNDVVGLASVSPQVYLVGR